jgi:transposase
MDEREQHRKIRHRLSILRHAEEISGNVAATCRYYGISRPTFYKWLRQFEEFGEEGLRDRSSRPRTCPHQTDGEIVGKIVYLRQYYHFGPAKISMYLARYHEVMVSRSRVWRILKRLEMNRLPSSQRNKRHERRWKRYEKQLPGHRVQVDVKFVEPLTSGAGRRAKRYYQFTAIDDCTRIRALRIYDRNTPEVRDPVHRLRAGQAALRRRGRPDGQRFRVPRLLPLAPARPGDRPHLHQAPHPSAQRQGA